MAKNTDLEKEYEEYLKSQYAEYQAGQQEEVPAEKTSRKYKSFKEDIGGITPEDISASSDMLSDILITAPQGLSTWSDEAFAGIGAGAQKLSGREEPFMDLYEQNVGEMRQDIANARERSPVATTLGEMGTGIASSFVPGLGMGKLTSAGAKIGRAAFEGLGTAEDKLGWEGATQAAIGGGLGAGGALIEGAAKKLSTANPNKIRANVLGARTSEFKEIGIKDREKIAKELKDMGLFSNQKVDFDVANGKFVPVGKSLENLEKPARDKLLQRLDTATKKIQDEKLKLLGKHIDDPIPLSDIELALDSVVESYASKGTGMEARRNAAEEVKSAILSDIMEDMDAANMPDATIGLVEAAKKRLSDDVSNYGKNPLLQKTPDSAQIYQSMYTAINDKLKKAMGNNKYAKFNDMQQKMITVKADLYKAMATEDAQRTQAGWGGWFNKIANETLGSPEAGLGIAGAAENLAKIPQGIQNTTRMGVSELPFQVQRSWMDTSMPAAQPPQSQEIPMAPQGYNFQNTKPAFRKINSVQGMSPVELENIDLPRNTKDILQNKDLLIAKLTLAGAPDEMIKTLAQALDKRPGSVNGLMQQVVLAYPGIFTESKYSTFDGYLLDPNDKAKAADDTSRRDDLNSLQKAKIINELNKTGKWLGE